jgi:predicted dithiol-disulfide oxidoreductase (DUF899 family)
LKKQRRNEMATHKQRDKTEGHIAMKTPPVVSWEAARQRMLVEEKAFTRTRDGLAAERRRMPWMAFEGPKGKLTLLYLFERRRQLILYRAFFEPGVLGWPENGCPACSLDTDQVAHLAHLNARGAPQTDYANGMEDAVVHHHRQLRHDFGVDQWHGHNVFFREGDKVFGTYFINGRGEEARDTTWSYLDITALGRQETWEDSPEGYPQIPPYERWNWHDKYEAAVSPDPKWIDMITDPYGAAVRRRAPEAQRYNCSCAR